MNTGRRLVAYLKPYRGLFVLGIAATTLAGLLDSIVIVTLIPLLKHLFGTAGVLAGGNTWLETTTDRLLAPLLVGTTDAGAAARIVMVMLFGLFIKNATSYGASLISVYIQEGLTRDLRSELFGHLLRLDPGFFQRTRGGQLIGRVTQDVDATKGAVVGALSSFMQNFVILIGTLAVLASISWRLTLLTLLAAPLLILSIQKLLGPIRRNARAAAQESGELTATVSERLGAIRLIRAYNGEAREAAAFRDQADRYRKRIIRTQRFAMVTSPISEVFGGCLLIMIIYAGTIPAITGTVLAPQVLIVFLVFALKMMSPLKSISQFPSQISTALASAERIFQVLDRPPAEVDPPGAREAKFEREVVFDHVTFAYEGNPPVLHDVSFTVPRGSIVALVGPSGAGKTTLVDMLPRFHDPVKGAVLLDGTPLTAFTRHSIRALLGVVSQDTVLLNDTVHANIGYGKPGATREQVEAAAEAANAAEFIRGLPTGYDTLLGERGTRLSGGQRQRIAIARALLRDPPILVLDEATSALDTQSERLVQEAIDRLMQDRTVLVIAHRLATVRHADTIVVLEGGEVVEQGSHEELFKAGKLYRRLYDLQFRDEPATAPVAVEE
ncbi:MAG TPA: ABC transporter ATP-binding protein [Gemmatimonadales bacterium]|nr:ABC transporter ATP-binding protein [Gemmatimonadales bacterium]